MSQILSIHWPWAPGKIHEEKMHFFRDWVYLHHILYPGVYHNFQIMNIPFHTHSAVLKEIIIHFTIQQRINNWFPPWGMKNNLVIRIIAVIIRDSFHFILSHQSHLTCNHVCKARLRSTLATTCNQLQSCPWPGCTGRPSQLVARLSQRAATGRDSWNPLNSHNQSQPCGSVATSCEGRPVHPGCRGWAKPRLVWASLGTVPVWVVSERS